MKNPTDPQGEFLAMVACNREREARETNRKHVDEVEGLLADVCWRATQLRVPANDWAEFRDRCDDLLTHFRALAEQAEKSTP